MLKELIKYLKILHRQANRFERTDNNGYEHNTFKEKYLVRLLFIFISVIIICFLRRGFSSDFISLISSILSILVGLFITALIFSFDKFYEPNSTQYESSRIKVWETQAYNYAKRFAFMTSKTIVISIFTLAALVLSSLFPKYFDLLLFQYKFIENVDELFNGLLLFIRIFLNIFQRLLVLYLLFRIAYSTLFIVTSMVHYMTTQMDRKK